MIKVDGIKIPKVVSLECNTDTNFLVFIEFHHDTRLENCIDIDDIEEYKPQKVQEETDEQIGISRIIVDPKELNINT